MIDTHCHLNLPPLSDDPAKYWEESQDQGVTNAVIVGADINSSKLAVEIARELKLKAAVGIHPEEAGGQVQGARDQEREDSENKRTEARGREIAETRGQGQEAREKNSYLKDELEKLLTDDVVCAIGECGLDYSSCTSENLEKLQENQRNLFELQLELALSHRLPLIIHCRNTRKVTDIVTWDAYTDLLTLLENAKKQYGELPHFVLHCASGSVSYVKRAVALGAYVSFAGNVTYPSATAIRDLLAVVPFDRLLVETDSPFLSPQSQRGKINTPAGVMETARFLADFLQIPFEKLQEKTTDNAKKFFHL